MRVALRFPDGDPVNGGGRGTRKPSGDKAVAALNALMLSESPTVIFLFFFHLVFIFARYTDIILAP